MAQIIRQGRWQNTALKFLAGKLLMLSLNVAHDVVHELISGVGCFDCGGCRSGSRYGLAVDTGGFDALWIYNNHFLAGGVGIKIFCAVICLFSNQ